MHRPKSPLEQLLQTPARKDTVKTGSMSRYDQPHLLQEIQRARTTHAPKPSAQHAGNIPTKATYTKQTASVRNLQTATKNPATSASSKPNTASAQPASASSKPNTAQNLETDINTQQASSSKRVGEDEKFELLFRPHARAISNQTFARAISLYLSIVILCSVYIFVRELIYQASKEYAELEGKKEVLIEENKQLERKIEALQFKNKITNYFEVKYE